MSQGFNRPPDNSYNYPGYPYPPYPYPPYPYPQFMYPGANPHPLPYKSDSVAQTDPIIKPKKPESRFQFNPLSNPLTSFEFSEFREKTLPMVRINKLTKIQALVRGWFTRKYILPYKKRIHFFAKRVLDYLIEDYIEDNLLPEIILEIINTNFAYKDYSLYTPDFRLIVQIADGIENKVIHLLCEEVVKEITRFIVQGYLRQRNEELIVSNKWDPISICMDDLIEIVIDKEIKALVPLTIRSEASDYLLEANIENIIRNQFIPIYCREIINEAAWEIAEERFVDENLEVIISQHINDIIIDSAEAEKDRIDLETLEDAFNAFMQRTILKEAINELIFLSKEYHDEEFLKNNVDVVQGDDLSEFVMVDDFYGSPELNKKKTTGAREPQKKDSEGNFSKHSERIDEKSQESSRNFSSGSEMKNSQEIRIVDGNNKKTLGASPGFTAPKSPRNKRNVIGFN